MNDATYRANLRLIYAIDAQAPAWVRSAKFNGIKPISHFTRTCWRVGFPYHPDERAKPRVKGAN